MSEVHYNNILLESCGILAVLVSAIVLSFAYQKIAMPILLGSALRVALLVLSLGFVRLPDSDTDALDFQTYARDYFAMPLSEAILTFPGYGDPYGYSLAISFVYRIAGPNALIMQVINCIANTMSICVIYRAASKLWDERSGQIAAWLVALFPAFALYSVLTMRESLTQLLISVSAYYVVLWSKNRKWRNMALALCALGGAGFFHPGALAGAAVLIAVTCATALKATLLAASRVSVHPASICVVAAAIAVAVPFIVGAVSIPYLGNINEALSIEKWVSLAAERAHGGAAYPSFLTPEDPAIYLLIMPLRWLYFFCSPFIWDITSMTQIAALLDGIIYMSLLIVLIVHWRFIVQRYGSRLIAFVALGLLIAFSIGSSNSGNSLRHRAKIAPLLIILAVPWVPRLTIQKLPCVGNIRVSG